MSESKENGNPDRYTAAITRSAPSAFVFLLDRSASMEDRLVFGEEKTTKARAVAFLLNGMLEELVARCRREEGYRNCFDVAVIGYGGRGVASLLPEGPSHPFFRKPDELAGAPVGTERRFRERVLPDGRTVTTVTETRRWIEPAAEGVTPMHAALKETHGLLRRWIGRHAGLPCFPPVVIHITDGEATDAGEEELSLAAARIRGLATENGNVLLLNVCLARDGEERPGILFPASEAELPENPRARLLFRMSSPLPGIYADAVAGLTGRPGGTEYRGMGYNTSVMGLIGLLNIGTASLSLVE